MEGNSQITAMYFHEHYRPCSIYDAPLCPTYSHSQIVLSVGDGILEGLPPTMKVQFSLEQFLAANTFLNEKGEHEAAQPWPMGRGGGPPMRQGLEDAK